MSKINNLAYPLLFTLLLMVLSSTCHGASKTIVLGTTNSPDTPLYQHAYIKLTALFNALGYQLELKEVPNKRSLEWANSGKFDGEAFRISNLSLKEYPNLRRIDPPIFTLDQYAFAKTNLPISGWHSLSQFIVAYESGTQFIEQNQRFFSQTMSVTDTQQAIELVLKGRADVTITSEATAHAILTELKLPKTALVKIEPALQTINLHLYINHHKHPELAQRLSSYLSAASQPN